MRKFLNSVLFVAIILFQSCYEDYAGKNQDEEKPGNKDNGNSILDLSLSADGRFLVKGESNYENYSYSDKILTVLDLKNGGSIKIEFNDPENASKIVFGKDTLAYVLVESEDIFYVQEFDLASGEKKNEWMVHNVLNMAVDETNTKVIVWGDNDVEVIDTAKNSFNTAFFGNEIADVKWLPRSNEIAIIQSLGRAETKIDIVDSELKAGHSISVPNCASSLEISPDGKTGMIAPTSCPKDPVSVIDLEKYEFVENLPGFGPVAFAPDGKYAVAFARKSDLLSQTGIETEAKYSILFINLKNYEFEVLELGSNIPIYTITPDSELVLLYSDDNDDNYNGIVVINYDSKTIRHAFGKNVKLNEYVMTKDSKSVFLIDNRVLYNLDTETLVVKEVTLTCGLYYSSDIYCKAEEIMIAPDGKDLVFEMISGSDFALFNIEYQKIRKIIHVKDQI